MDQKRFEGIKVTQSVEALSRCNGHGGGAVRRGALLVAGAALAWSSAGLITRATTTDAWTTLFWRSVFSTIFLVVYIALRDRGRAVAAFRALGLPGSASPCRSAPR